ncbi:MAG: metallophosphoesterase [Rhodospirillales bacterium]|nr:metallophosphoesterase [Rhodospirillales bacterium]
MIIAQISDLHILVNPSNPTEGADRIESLRRCVADINRQGVDAVIHTGDSAHFGAEEEYAIVRDALAELKAPVFLIPGNRDRRETLRAAFEHLDYLPMNGAFLHYAIEDLPIRLVGLDSVSEGDNKGAFCVERRTWLDETLGREPDRPTLLFIHHPPFDIDPDFLGGYRRPEEARELTAAVERHPQVKHLLCGHVHFSHRESWAGAVATTMPSVAVDLSKEKDVLSEAATRYVLHVAANDGSLASRTRIVTD